MKLNIKRADDMDVIKQIVCDEFGLDIMRVKRARGLVDGRIIVSLVLYEYGYDLSSIARFFKKHHTTIMHYRNTGSDIMDVDPEFRERYFRCRDKFIEDREVTQDFITQDQMRMNLLDLQNKLYVVSKDLSMVKSDNENMKNVLEKYKRIKSIVNFIDDNTPEGVEEYVLDVLKDTFKKLKT